MKCIILAAGYATRLYPLTENFPKPLLEVKGKTILDWLVDDITFTNKIDEFIIISNHKYIDSFDKWIKEKNSDIKISLLDDGTTSNENRKGAVADIEFAIKKLNLNDDLLVIAGDNVLDFSLDSFIDYFYEKKSTCIMRYYEESIERLKRSATVCVDEFDKVLEMIEKPLEPTSNWCSPAFYIYKKEDVKKVKEALDSGCSKDAPGSFISWLYDKSIVHAMEMPGKRYDIGTLESYHLVNEEYNGINN